MAQSIKIKIAGTEYPLMANTPEMEQFIRLAAEEINAMLGKYDARFPDKPLVDKLAFVTLNETVAKITAQRRLAEVKEEVSSLCADTEAYLKGKE